MMEVSPEVRRRNRLVALACVAFAFSVYSYSIRKLKEVRGEWGCFLGLGVVGCVFVVQCSVPLFRSTLVNGRSARSCGGHVDQRSVCF